MLKRAGQVHGKAHYELKPFRPYSLSHTGARLSHFPEVVDRFEAGTYRRLVFVGGDPHLLEVEQCGPPSRAVLHLTITGNRAECGEARQVANRVLERVLGIRSDVRPFYRKFRDDPLLGPIIREFRGLRIAGRASVWDTLIQIVTSQQVNLTFAHLVQCELARSLGRRARFNGELYFNLPSPARISSMSAKELRAFKLSRGKSETLLQLAKAFQSGELSDEKLGAMTDPDLLDFLTSFKGIGRWTAEFTALRGLARLDVFPGGDLGVVKYLAREILGRSAPATEGDMRAFAERWRPYRGLALIYAYAEIGRRTSHKET